MTQISTKEIVVQVNTARYKKGLAGKQHITEYLQTKGVPAVILDGEIVVEYGDLCWSTEPGSSYTEYYFNP